MIIAFFFGVIGFVIAKISSGKTEGEKGIIPSIIIRKNIADYKLIIHYYHWLFSFLLILVFVLLFNKVFDLTLYLLITFFTGVMIQGLTYKDSFDVLKIIRLTKINET